MSNICLKDFFKKYNKAAIAFSGGVDSSYLVYAAKKYNVNFKAYFIKTALQPQFELEDATTLAQFLNAEISVIDYDISENEMILRNSSERCYYCKRTLFNVLKKHAAKDGFSVLLDGTNFSDSVNDRPGMKALEELKVLSPLRICKLTKSDIRKLSKESGLFTWNKPAYACLGTRISTGTKIEPGLLKKIELAEGFLFELGFSDFRARIEDSGIKLQLPLEQFQEVLDRRETILNELLKNFSGVVLDLIPRCGR